MLWPLVRRNESSPHESKGWVAWIDGLSMPHAFIWAKKLLTSPIAGGWESEVNTLNLRFRAGCGTAQPRQPAAALAITLVCDWRCDGEISHLG